LFAALGTKRSRSERAQFIGGQRLHPRRAEVNVDRRDFVKLRSPVSSGGKPGARPTPRPNPGRANEDGAATPNGVYPARAASLTRNARERDVMLERAAACAQAIAAKGSVAR
jgi:hypothetical protein